MDELKDRIKRHEGLRLGVYQDTLGNLSVGYGRNLMHGIRESEADFMFENDFDRARNAAASLPGYLRCNQARRGVLIEMVYQMGYLGTLNFSKMMNALLDADYERAADEMMNSNWYKQTPVRCRALSEIMRNGET